MKKLVLIVDKYPFGIGGMETHAYEFIKFFKKQKQINLISIIAFSSNVQIKYVKNNNEFGVPLIIFPEVEIYNGNALITELKRFNIGDTDVIFFNSLYWIRIFSKIRSHFLKTKLVLRSGGNDLIHAQITGVGKKLKMRQTFVVNMINRNINFLIVNSAYSYNRFKKLGIAQKIMQVIIGGVDTNRFVPKKDKTKLIYRQKLGLPNTTIILTVCRFVPFKNVVLTLQSIHKMKNQSVVHVLVGDGPELHNIQKTINKLKIHDKIILTGFIPLKKIHSYFQASDIYCQTPVDTLTKVEGGSYIQTETMGRSFCEALSSGIPIVATDVGGIKEIVFNKKIGFFTQKGNAKSLGRYLDILASNVKLRKKMGMLGREHALKKLSWEVVFKNYLKKFII